MIFDSPINIAYPEIPFGEYILSCLPKYGSDIALVDAEDDKFLTFADIDTMSRKCITAMLSMGIKKGDCVACSLVNCLEYPVIVIAAVACGASITACNPYYTAGELTAQFKKLSPKLVFVNADNYDTMLEVSREISSIKNIVSIEEHPTCNTFSNLLKSSSKALTLPSVSINPRKDVMLFLHSSGTTGLPKAVTHTHFSFIALLQSLPITVPSSRCDVVYLIPPMYHILGCSVFLNSLLFGGKLIISKTFDLAAMYEIIEKHKVTFFPAVPPLLLALYNTAHLFKNDLSSLKSILSGAAPLPQAVAEGVQKKFGVRVYQVWGLTEGVFTTAAPPSIPLTSVGIPFPGNQFKIVDPESGKILGVGQDGEICGRGPSLMQGYYKNPTATSQCIDKEGWFHTGDIGHFDKFGCLYIVDRLKELIKYKGFQVAPAELEQLLLEHPKITDVAVIGVPDLAAGELPKAFIVRSDESLTETEVQNFVKGKVVHYKYLRGGVEFCDSIPKSPSGKILRRVLRQQNPKAKL